MVHLKEVSVYVDDVRLVHLSKESGVPRSLTLPKGLKATSGGGTMRVQNMSAKCEYLSILEILAC